jgi:hypothetical protein
MKYHLATTFLLLSFLSFAQEKSFIYCPIDQVILKKNKVSKIDISREDTATGAKELINTFFIDKKTGAAYKELYLPNVPNSKWMKREIKKNANGLEITYLLSEITNDSTEKLFEKRIESYNPAKQLVNA